DAAGLVDLLGPEVVALLLFQGLGREGTGERQRCAEADRLLGGGLHRNDQRSGRESGAGQRALQRSTGHRVSFLGVDAGGAESSSPIDRWERLKSERCVPFFPTVRRAGA